jgi:hypothetical protein
MIAVRTLGWVNCAVAHPTRARMKIADKVPENQCVTCKGKRNESGERAAKKKKKKNQIGSGRTPAVMQKQNVRILFDVYLPNVENGLF